jgi:hypothetical protein
MYVPFSFSIFIKLFSPQTYAKEKGITKKYKPNIPNLLTRSSTPNDDSTLIKAVASAKGMLTARNLLKTGKFLYIMGSAGTVLIQTHTAII